MIKNSSILINSRESVVVFVFTVVVSLFWFSSQVFNVYHEPLLGALYEFLSIVMLLALFGLPVYSLTKCIRNRFNHRSLYLYSFLVSLITILLLFIQFD